MLLPARTSAICSLRAASIWNVPFKDESDMDCELTGRGLADRVILGAVDVVAGVLGFRQLPETP